jgi:histidyl-tRNA synthetase
LQATFIDKAGGSEILDQMWAFADKKGRACCLIPEATALFQEQAAQFLRRRREAQCFYIARCYRYERPQAGRYREFTQLGFEYLCADPQAARIASLALCRRFLDGLGLEYETVESTRRGLSYYLDGDGFEIRCPVLGAQQQLAGGGAYREGAGFAIGLERLLLALELTGLADRLSGPQAAQSA